MLVAIFPCLKSFCFLVLAQLHQKLEYIEQKNEEVENRNNFTFSHLEKQINDSTELGISFYQI